jgi:hypothetical protein
MMNVPLRDLEEALRDPRVYAIKRSTPSLKFFPRSKYLTLQRAIYKYHSNKDLVVARQYLVESFSRQFKDQEDLPDYEEKLETYAERVTRSKTAVVRVKDRLTIPLRKPLSDQFKVSGDIPRIDLTSSGYSVWLFAKTTESWGNELRLPLIQSAYARQFDSSFDEVRVGVYDFSTGDYSDYGFTEREIRAADRSLSRLLQQLA